MLILRVNQLLDPFSSSEFFDILDFLFIYLFIFIKTKQNIEA